MTTAEYLSGVNIKHPTVKNDSPAYVSGGKKTFDSTLTDYLTTVETVERAIRIHVNVMSLTKLEIFKKDSNNKLKPLKVNNIDLEFPNEIDSYIDLNRKLGTSLFMQGAGMLMTEKSKGKINFYNIDVTRMRMESDGKSIISSFIYTAEDGTELTYRPKDVIYINDSIDPSNLIYSLSRLKSLNDVLLMQGGVVQRAKEFTAGNAKDSAIVSTNVPLSGDVQSKINTAFNEFMQSNTSSTLFVNTDLKVDSFSSSMSATELLNFFTELNKVIIDQFNIPPSLLGDYGGSANKNEEVLYSLKIWFNVMVKPILRNIELQMTRYFREVLGLKNAVLKYNFNEIDILDDHIDQKVERATKLHKVGIISLNEARELCELEPLDSEQADNHYFPAFLLGSSPVSVENFNEELDRYLRTGSTDSLPSGSSGDEDNESVTEDIRGGPNGA